MISLKEQALNYFETFSSKDLNKLKLFFNDFIELRDWEIQAKGIDKVIEANRKIFESVDSIKVNPVELNELNNKIFAELSIVINQSETIKVLDIIEFDSNNKISSIKAFKG